MNFFGQLHVLISLGILGLGVPADAAEIILDPSVRFQTMSGWEATADLPDNPTSPKYAPYREEMLDRIVNEIGINRLRLEVRSGAENSSTRISDFISGKLHYDQWADTRYRIENDNEDPFEINWDGFDFAELDWHMENTVLPIRKRVEANGERLIVNLNFVDFEKRAGFLLQPEEYAEFVLATYLHLSEKYAFSPDTWEVILEPDLLNSGWTGTVIGHAMVAAGRRLEEHGFQPAFIAPSVTNMSNAVPFVEAIAAVPGAMDHFVEFSYHRYRGANVWNLTKIARTAQKYRLPTSMLELWFGKANHHVLYQDLTLGNVVAFQGRVDRGLFDVSNVGTFALSPRSEIRFNLLYYRSIRHGAVRILASSDEPKDFAPVAFINSDGRYAVVVRATRGGAISVGNLPEGNYFISYAIEAGSKDNEGPIRVGDDGLLEATIPAAGVLAILAE